MLFFLVVKLPPRCRTPKPLVSPFFVRVIGPDLFNPYHFGSYSLHIRECLTRVVPLQLSFLDLRALFSHMCTL